MASKPPNKRIQLEIPANLKATYANLALISHTPSEFFIDFAQLLPNTPKSQVNTRMVMSPTHAKALLKALGENLDRYEAQHGEINVPPSQADQLAAQLFSGVKPPEPESDDESE